MNTKYGLSARDYAKTMLEFRPLAEQGHDFAQFALGVMYKKGQGVPRDDTEAAKWFHLAAEQGHTDAQLQLGMMYRKGQGVSQNENEAEKWYQLALNPLSPT